MDTGSGGPITVTVSIWDAVHESSAMPASRRRKIALAMKKRWAERKKGKKAD